MNKQSWIELNYHIFHIIMLLVFVLIVNFSRLFYFDLCGSQFLLYLSFFIFLFSKSAFTINDFFLRFLEFNHNFVFASIIFVLNAKQQFLEIAQQQEPKNWILLELIIIIIFSRRWSLLCHLPYKIFLQILLHS